MTKPTQFKGVKPDQVRHITCIGGGPIGSGWAAWFLARGFHVTTYLHDPAEEASVRALIDTAWVSLESLSLSEGASRKHLHITSDLEEAVAWAEFIQECAPENIELKQKLYSTLCDITPDSVVIASSTSGLLMTDIQATCSSPERTVVGHPFNPPYLLPLVEVVGGKKTAPEVVQWVTDFYRFAGKGPLVLPKETPGFIATRLQEAMWREALHMIANGEASVQDIDFAIVNGPGPRWAMMGPCMTYHLGGGEGGMAYCLEQFGPALKYPWSRLEAPELSPELFDRLVQGSAEMAGDRDYVSLNIERDKALVAIIKMWKESSFRD
jgi:carnitine 3-dehydrogenase